MDKTPKERGWLRKAIDVAREYRVANPERVAEVERNLVFRRPDNG